MVPGAQREDRSWVGTILQAGVRGFVDWFEKGGDSSGPASRHLAFGAAPRALAGVTHPLSTPSTW